MDYLSYEQSVASGQPVELFDIAMGDTHWRLTSCGADYEYLGDTYEYEPCKCSELEQTGEIPKDGIDLELPINHPFGIICIAGTPEEEVTLIKYRGHGGFFETDFRGFLTSVKFNKIGVPVCKFEPRSSDLPSVGGRRRCMRLCGHKLYGYRCGLDKEDYKITGTIDSIDGVTITSSEFGDADIPEPEVYGDLTGLDGCIYAANLGTPSYAFDNSIQSGWSALSYTDNWITCQWTSSQTIKKIRIRPCVRLHSHSPGYDVGETNMKHFRVAGSNNGSDWTTIPVMQWFGNCHYYAGQGGSDTLVDLIIDPAEWIGVILDNDNAYTYYRIWVYDTWGGTSTLIVNEIEMIAADNTMDTYTFGAGGEIIVGTASRNIIAQVGDTITINRPFGSDVVADDPFSAYPGCAHTPGCCRDKFENWPNYGGQEFLPVKNPYTGNLIY